MTSAGCTIFFTTSLAGGEPQNNAPFLQLFMRHFLGTGFSRKTVKALPIFCLGSAGPLHDPGGTGENRVEEPLDGILIGAASGGGFAIMETLCQIRSSVSSEYLDNDRLGIPRHFRKPEYVGRFGQDEFR